MHLARLHRSKINHVPGSLLVQYCWYILVFCKTPSMYMYCMQIQCIFMISSFRGSERMREQIELSLYWNYAYF